jgi:hypothetical protein
MYLAGSVKDLPPQSRTRLTHPLLIELLLYGDWPPLLLKGQRLAMLVHEDTVPALHCCNDAEDLRFLRQEFQKRGSNLQLYFYHPHEERNTSGVNAATYFPERS